VTQTTVPTTRREVHVLEVPLEGRDPTAVRRVYTEWRDALGPVFGADLEAGWGEVPHHVRLWWPDGISPAMLGVLAERVSTEVGHAFLHLWVPVDPEQNRPLPRPSPETIIDTYVAGRRIVSLEED
jgi:hypothetical protein